ncbi:uncharacterized protein [Typha angustifolia]|uniref:uncharacterized protein n=1 Tax=Typha angustifolia TaxID=59011 RepID=UPI003C307D54
MGSLLHSIGLVSPRTPPPHSNPPKLASISKSTARLVASRNAHLLFAAWFGTPNPRSLPLLVSSSSGSVAGEEEPEVLVEVLRVPDAWLIPSNALQESEWLREKLHKWLDDEYCPEPTNVEISKLAARSYYDSLMAKQADLGEILLKMVRDLETLSFQESFHGPFSSANAAVHLITLRMESLADT